MALNTHALSLVSASSQAVSITDSAALKPTTDFTIEAWIKTTSVGGIIFQSYSANPFVAGISVAVGGTGKAAFLVGKNTGATGDVDYKLFSSIASINDGNWHHLVFKWDAGTLYIYVDGVIDNSIAWVNAPGYAATSYVRIGCGSDSGVNQSFFNGQIDEVRLWSDARTTQEILDSMYADVTGEANLVGFWKFDNDLTDETGVHNGAAIATPTFTTNSAFSDHLSPSISPSASKSPSSSASLSVSPSASFSRSVSPSASKSPSSSQSPSSSVSPSSSWSVSTSVSPSPSASPSPAPEGMNYTRAALASLPSGVSDLNTRYTTPEEGDVEHDDERRVSVTSAGAQYLIHQFKRDNTNNKDYIRVTLNLQSSLAPSVSPVFLQIYNHASQMWETVDSDIASDVDEDFDLSAFIEDDVADYYDADYVVTVRVYQLAT